MTEEQVVDQIDSSLDPREEAITTLCDKVKELLSSSETNELDVLHEVGTDILAAKDQEIYGPNLTKEVASRLGTYRQKIQFSVRLAHAYDEAALEELRGHKTKDGGVYVWSATHVRFLLRVKNESERASLAKECAESNWPCRKLQKEVGAMESGPSSAARKPAADLTSSLEALLKFFQQWTDFVNLNASPQTNIYDKFTAAKNLTEKQRGLISQVTSLSPGFTEKICEMNGYLSLIEMKDK